MTYIILYDTSALIASCDSQFKNFCLFALVSLKTTRLVHSGLNPIFYILVSSTRDLSFTAKNKKGNNISIVPWTFYLELALCKASMWVQGHIIINLILEAHDFILALPKFVRLLMLREVHDK